MWNLMIVIDQDFDRSDLILDTNPSLSTHTDSIMKSERNFDHFEISDSETFSASIPLNRF